MAVFAGVSYYLSPRNSGSRDSGSPASVEQQEKIPGETTERNDREDTGNETNREHYDSRRADVLEVFDGDTLKVQFVQSGTTRRIRIKGIDCPESSEEIDKCWSSEDLIDIPCEEQVPLGKRATAYAKGLLADETIELESYSGFDKGEHGRTLAYVRTPGERDYGLEAVRKGYCKDSGVRYDHPREDTYEKHRRGIKR